MSSQSKVPINESDRDKNEDTVDPRVQIELERLNAATDDINRLEVDLDEARAGFRQLLCESTARLDALARKLGTCVEKARPYYEARIKAKEALHNTQLAAVRFERANSAHAAAKEMVYLAEEGLCTEGRTFDHAWQEMLNHATMRVNESEVERTLSEAEHRRTSQCYQRAEIRVQQLQKDLKRSIVKSSMNTIYALLAFNHLTGAVYFKHLPYFEVKAQFNSVFEEQKGKVKELERRVGAAKASYSEALSNLEQISDEIHRIRQYETEQQGKRAVGSLGTSMESPQTALSATTISSSTDHWSDSEATGSPDSESEEQYLRLPDKLGPAGSPIIPKKSQEENILDRPEFLTLSTLSKIRSKSRELTTEGQNSHVSDERQPHDSTMETSFVNSCLGRPVSAIENEPEEENVIQSLFSKIVPAKLRQTDSERSGPLKSKAIESSDKSNTSTFVSNPSFRTLPGSYSDDVFTLPDDRLKPDQSSVKDQAETWSEVGLTASNKTTPESERMSNKQGEIWTEVNLNDSSSQSTDAGDVNPAVTEDINSTPVRSKLDSSLSNWISRSSVEQNTNGSRRQSLDTLIMGSLATGERVKEILSQGIMKLNISSLTERRSSEPRSDKQPPGVLAATATKKVPSPLEKSIFYLNPDDDSASDSESLASVEMLSDEQISSLMLDQEIQDACQEVLGTPLGEIAPLQR